MDISVVHEYPHPHRNLHGFGAVCQAYLLQQPRPSTTERTEVLFLYAEAVVAGIEPMTTEMGEAIKAMDLAAAARQCQPSERSLPDIDKRLADFRKSIMGRTFSLTPLDGEAAKHLTWIKEWGLPGLSSDVSRMKAGR